MLLDCANGATFRAAPTIFERLGARSDDGDRARRPQHQRRLRLPPSRPPRRSAIVDSEATVGFAFDGDGDRVLAVDGSGRTHDGDKPIALAARGMAARGELGGGVAVTVMSNYGFHQAMEEAGIEVAVTSVGDRYVLDELRERGWALGGEQSGHIIDTRFVATGDGTAAALATMRELAGRDLATVAPMEKLPQTLVNVEVADREAIAAPRRSGRRSSARAKSWRGAAGCCSARPAPSRWCG